MPKLVRQYHRPSDLESARALLRGAGAAPLLPGPRLPDPPFGQAEAVVDLSRLGLDFIHLEAGQFRLGALTPLQALAESGLLRAAAGGLLSEAARLTAASGLRQLATLGGALVAREGPAEVRLALLALGAHVVVLAETRLEHPLQEWPAPAADEILLEVRFAAPVGAQAALERVALAPRDEAIVCVVGLRGADGALRLCSSPLPGGVVDLPAGTQAAEAGRALQAVVTPHSDFRASADYRGSMAGVLAARLVRRLQA